MSYDLGVFFTARPLTEDDALARYSAYCDGKDIAHLIEPSPRIGSFLKELTDRYPKIDDVYDADLDDCPWSIAFDLSEGHVILPMVFSHADEVAPYVVKLAKKHRLVCVDPQEGRIRTAPPKLVVEETEPTAQELEAEARRKDAPLLALVDELLVPRGFKSRARIWRKDDTHAVSAVQAIDPEGIFKLAFCMWSKDEGEEATPGEVKPYGDKYHLRHELDGELLPEPLHFRLLRAFHFGIDYADAIASIYGTDQEGQAIAPYYEPRQPLTTEWRVATLREAMVGYVLPFFDRVDAGDQKAMLEQHKAELEHERDEAWKQCLAKWTPVIDKCRALSNEGADDKAIVDVTRAVIQDRASEAVILSIALGWTMSETRVRMEAVGRTWTSLTEEFIDLFFEDNDGLSMLPEGRVELRARL